MQWRRLFLSLILSGGSIWCLAVVQQVHSEERAGGLAPSRMTGARPAAPALSAELRRPADQDAHRTAIRKTGPAAETR